MSNLSDKKLSPEELSEAVRPVISSLLIQKISGVKEALNIVTFNPDFEQMLITMSKKSSAEGLLIDPSLAKEMIQSLIEIGDKFSFRRKFFGYSNITCNKKRSLYSSSSTYRRHCSFIVHRITRK